MITCLFIFFLYRHVSCIFIDFHVHVIGLYTFFPQTFIIKDSISHFRFPLCKLVQVNLIMIFFLSSEFTFGFFILHFIFRFVRHFLKIQCFVNYYCSLAPLLFFSLLYFVYFSTIMSCLHLFLCTQSQKFCNILVT